MSIPALPYSPPTSVSSGNSTRPAIEARAVPEARTGSVPAVGELGNRAPLVTVPSTDAIDKVGQAEKKKELEEAVAQLNEKLKPFIQEAVRFQVDEDSGKLIVAVVDTEKNTVLRQIPTQEALKMSRGLTPGQQPGLLVNTKA